MVAIGGQEEEAREEANGKLPVCSMQARGRVLQVEKKKSVNR